MSDRTTWIALGALAAVMIAGLVAASVGDNAGDADRASADRSSDGTARVEAPFTTVDKDKDSTRIKAPFVDIEVPNKKGD